MTCLDNSKDQSDIIRHKTIQLLEEIRTKADEFELPKPPTALKKYHRSLLENKYKVLVVGEASVVKAHLLML